MKDSRIICKHLLWLPKEFISKRCFFQHLQCYTASEDYWNDVWKDSGILKRPFLCTRWNSKFGWCSIIKFAKGISKFEWKESGPLPSNVSGLNCKHSSINNERVTIILIMASVTCDLRFSSTFKLVRKIQYRLDLVGVDFFNNWVKFCLIGFWKHN